MRWVKKYQTSQSIDRNDRVNVAYKINQQHINQIYNILNGICQLIIVYKINVLTYNMLNT